MNFKSNLGAKELHSHFEVLKFRGGGGKEHHHAQNPARNLSEGSRFRAGGEPPIPYTHYSVYLAGINKDKRWLTLRNFTSILHFPI